MVDFAYNALAKDGRHINGTISAASREDALTALKTQGNKPLSIKEATPSSIPKFSLGGKSVKSRDVVVFTRELSTMISAGVPLPRGLGTLADQAEAPYLKKVLRGVNHDVEAGVSLADSLAKYPKVFNDVYINMVRAGEAGGILDDILKRLATQVEKEASMRKKIRSAMAYPIVILTVTIIAFFGIMIFILPKIDGILKDLGGPNAKLPVYSQALLNVSGFVQKYAIPIVVLSVIFVFAFKHYIGTEKGKYRWHGLILRTPVIGKVIAKIAIARFARTFSSLMTAGVSVLDSLEVTSKAVGNRVIQKEIMNVASEVKNGQPLGKQLVNAKYFPPIVGQMITVGEETGKIGEVLVKVADFYDEEVDVLIDSLTSIIEPVMIILLGALVGLIAASVMGPIASLSKNVSG